MHYHTWQRDYQTLRIESSRGVVINPSCLGWGVMSFWAAFVVANKGSWKHKLKWVTIGLASIILLNIFRIAVLAVANHLQWASVTSLDQHLTFNILSYCIIILMVVWFVSIQKKYEAAGRV
jgi:exosortase/archaeosortase family protein